MTLLAGPLFDGTAHVPNMVTVRAISHLTVVCAPRLVTMSMPMLADVPLAVPMTPKPQGFVVGLAWIEHGFLHDDEESAMPPPITAPVRTVQ